MLAVLGRAGGSAKGTAASPAVQFKRVSAWNPRGPPTAGAVTSPREQTLVLCKPRLRPRSTCRSIISSPAPWRRPASIWQRWPTPVVNDAHFLDKGRVTNSNYGRTTPGPREGFSVTVPQLSLQRPGIRKDLSALGQAWWLPKCLRSDHLGC